MSPTDNLAVDTATNKWTDFYARNRNDSGPFQTLFKTNVAAMARTTMAEHLNNVSRLTETIAGSDYGNMLLVPGRNGTMQLIHHGFACNTADGFSLAFAHGNLEDTTTYKTIDRGELVAPVAVRDVEGPEDATLAPTLERMMAAESPKEFSNLKAERNTILGTRPNHCLIKPGTFDKVGGAKTISSKDLALPSSRHSRQRQPMTTK